MICSRQCRGKTARGVAVAMCRLTNPASSGDDRDPSSIKCAPPCLFRWRKRKQRIMIVTAHSRRRTFRPRCMASREPTGRSFAGDAPARSGPAGCAISGYTDLTPLRMCRATSDFRLDVARRAARVAGCLAAICRPGPRLDAVVGGADHEFLRRATIIMRRRLAKTREVQTRYEEIPGANHFTVVDPHSGWQQRHGRSG